MTSKKTLAKPRTAPRPSTPPADKLLTLKCAELHGPALAYALARARLPEGASERFVLAEMLTIDAEDPQLAQQLAQRDGINTVRLANPASDNALWLASVGDVAWFAPGAFGAHATGATRALAVARCHLVKTLGRDLRVPAVLVGELPRDVDDDDEQPARPTSRAS